MPTTLEIRAPEEQTEGTRSQILRWLKGIGDAVAEHEPLIEIETDKVTVEVAAPASGVLSEILKGESQEIAPGDVLGRLEIQSAAAGAGESSPVEERTTKDARPDRQDSGHGATSALADPVPGTSRAEHSQTQLSPAVRRLIAEHGLDVTAIRATGPNGRITIDDVLAATSGATSSGAAPSSHTALSSSTESRALSADKSGETKSPTKAPAQSASRAAMSADVPSHWVPHSAIRKRIADHMVQSLLQTAPHVTTVFEADMTAVIAHRASQKADFESRGAPLTFTAYFLLGAAAAVRAVPEANSRWTDTALEIYDTLNIGVASAIEDVGLVVPVLRAVESKDLFEIARRLNELVTAARAGKLQPADVRNGTFTISNHGVSGSLLASPIVINQPQSAILGIGKLEKRVTIADGSDEITVRPKCYVTLTIDHRVMDGHRANQFLQTFVKALQTWPAR